jgi:hypothetical protein
MQLGGYVPTEGNRAKNGGMHPQEKNVSGTAKVGVAQTSGDGMAECQIPASDTDC